MKVSELVEQLQSIDPDSEVVVHLWGGLRGGCTVVTGATNGFDWYHGKVVLDTETPMTRFEKKPKEPAAEVVSRYRTTIRRILLDNGKGDAVLNDDHAMLNAIEDLIEGSKGE